MTDVPGAAQRGAPLEPEAPAPSELAGVPGQGPLPEPEAQAVLAPPGSEPGPGAQGAPAVPSGAKPKGDEADSAPGAAGAAVADAAEPKGAPEALVELGLSEVRLSVQLRPGQEAGLVVLAEMEEPFRALHIYVGQPEAKAVQAGWHGGRPARPGTWDLLLQAVELLGARLERVVIERVEEARHFFARLEIERAGEVLTLPCRPSDAIALAVRAPLAGIYATEEVMAGAGQYP